jgi:predicted glycosyltransferase involved in capsule biosynthesis
MEMKIVIEMDSDTKTERVIVDGQEISYDNIPSWSCGHYKYIDCNNVARDTYFNVTVKNNDGTKYSYGFSYNDKLLDMYDKECYSLSDDIANTVKNARYARSMAKFLKSKK